MNITLDVKTLITIGVVVGTLGGFYYSTEHRLTSLEDKIEIMQKDVTVVKRQLRKKNK